MEGPAKEQESKKAAERRAAMKELVRLVGSVGLNGLRPATITLASVRKEK